VAWVLALDQAAIRWLRVIAVIGFAALIIGAAIVTSDALLRTFAGKPIRGLGEIIDMSTAIVIATCVPIVVAQRRNIRIMFLSAAVGKLANLILDVIADLFMLAFVGVMSVELIAYTAQTISLGDRSLVHQIPAGPFWIAASAILLLSVPAQALITLISVLRLATGQSAPAQEAAPDLHI
jgi:TRAP-type C4-dicarboxylate transport system permease small subunit